MKMFPQKPIVWVALSIHKVGQYQSVAASSQFINQLLCWSQTTTSGVRVPDPLGCFRLDLESWLGPKAHLLRTGEGQRGRGTLPPPLPQCPASTPACLCLPLGKVRTEPIAFINECPVSELSSTSLHLECTCKLAMPTINPWRFFQ